MAISCAASWADIFIESTSSPTKAVDAEYFGIHFHRFVVRPTERAIPTQWPALTFGSVRLWDTVTRWGDVAPQPGVWYFARLDTFVHAAIQNNANVLYTLGSTPRWVSARPDEKCPYGYGCGAESVRLAHWEEYVRRVAQRYGNRIAAYELWNEPHFSDFARDFGKPGFFTGSMQSMVDMARVARKVLDEVSPTAKLCTPGFVNGPDRLEKFLADGGAKYVQAICYHFYAEGSEHFAKQVIEVRSVMARQGVAALPLWNTETGVDTLLPNDPPSGIAARTRAEAVARLNQLLILGAATGMERFYYYAWDNWRSGMVAADGQKLVGYEALEHLQKWLIASKFQGCVGNAKHISCIAERDSTRMMFAWTTSQTPAYVSIPQGFKVTAVDRLPGDPLQGPATTYLGNLNVQLSASPVMLVLTRE